MLASTVPAASKPPMMTIGVMGAAGGNLTDDAIERSYELGRSIALHGCILINGACPGLPFHAARGAKSVGGMTIGISPGLSFDEHVEKYGSPTEYLDLIIYTGSGLMGREVTNIRSSDIVIIAGGRSGTLGEFAIAYDEGKLIGVLEGTGGIVEALPQIVEVCKKDSGAHLIYDSHPKHLIDRLVDYYRDQHGQHPSIFHRRHHLPVSLEARD